MFHYVYKITNLIDNRIYIGVHSTKDLNDGYMGSCIPLTKDIKQYGESNFKKEILYFLKTREKALLKEKELVNQDFVSRSDTYNVNIGGSCGTPGLVPVKDINGNTFAVRVDDPKYISGEYTHVIKGIKYNITEEQHKLRSKYSSLVNRGTINLTNGIINKKVKKEKFEEFLKNNPGWRRGQTQHWSEESKIKASTGGKHLLNKIKKEKELEIKKLLKPVKKEKPKICNVTNGIKNKKICLEKLEEFLKNNPGWRRGQTNHWSETGLQKIKESNHNKKFKEYKWVNNGNKHKMIPKKELDKFLKNNPDYIIGNGIDYSNIQHNGTKGYKWMYLNDKLVYVNPSEITTYLNNGWNFLKGSHVSVGEFQSMMV